ncbi:MAG: hypothetical protein ACYTAF_04420, partial [Planctomycetota bacterium]
WSADDAFQLGFHKRDREKYLQFLAQIVINRLRREAPGRDRIPGLLKNLAKVAPEDVAAAAKKYLSKDRANILIIGKKKK